MASYTGCSNDSVIVRLDGVPIGKAYFRGRSADFLPATPGKVDASDISAFSDVYPCSIPAVCASSCMKIDPVGSPNVVNASDITALAAHVGHEAPGYPNQKPLLANATLSLKETQRSAGTLEVGVTLASVERASAFGVVVQINSAALEFAEWQPVPALEGKLFGSFVNDDEGARLVLLGMHFDTVALENRDLGTVLFNTRDAASVREDLQLTFGEFLRPDGTECGIVRAGKPTLPEGVVAYTTRLIGVEPNPSNPAATIQYAVAKDTQVTLVVYGIDGRRTRTLVNGHKARDVYSVLWDGDPFGSAGAIIGFYDPQAGACVRLFTTTITATTQVDEVVLEVAGTTAPGTCPVVVIHCASCFTHVCVSGGRLYINSATDWTVATQPSTWSQVKQLYDVNAQ